MLVLKITFFDPKALTVSKQDVFSFAAQLKNIFRILSLCVFLFAGFISLAQKEGLYWFFGQNAGLKFHNGYPEAISGSLVTSEGCATISDKYGNLRFYTDGITVYNKGHQIMVNGTDLFGDPSSTQSGVIVPLPGDTNIYYIFTVSNLKKGKEGGDGFRYSKVDMLLHNGYGEVTDKNIMIFEPTTERIGSVKHSNDYGVWVIGHEWESSRFRSYLITPAGINLDNPVISDVGQFQGGNELNGKGYMKVSPDGQKLAMVIQGENLIQVFDFNDTSGEISNPIDLFLNDQPYGIEFSKEANFLYASERYGIYIYQWDLQAGSAQEIADSRIIVGEFTEPNSLGGAMQMASDGKIYIARKQKIYLASINHPSLAGFDCDFTENAVCLGSKHFCQWGLPTFIQSYFNNHWIVHENQCVGDSIFLSLNDKTNVESVLWDFGDPESGANNHSEEFDTYHIYDNAGYYKVSLFLFYLNNCDTLIQFITIKPLPEVDLGNDLTICEEDSVLLKAEGNYQYCRWMDDPFLSDTVYVAKEEGLYWVSVTGVCGSDRDTVAIYKQPPPYIYLGQDTSIRYNTTIKLFPGNGYETYLWQDGSHSEEYIADYPGAFWVEVTDEFGCKSSDTIVIFPESFKICTPTAFSPNYDEVNDVFLPICTQDVDFEYELSIYNRYGQLVFKSNNFTNGWDGNYLSQPCPMEVYIWIIRVEPSIDDVFYSGPVMMKGNVTLLR